MDPNLKINLGILMVALLPMIVKAAPGQDADVGKVSEAIKTLLLL